MSEHNSPDLDDYFKGRIDNSGEGLKKKGRWTDHGLACARQDFRVCNFWLNQQVGAANVDVGRWGTYVGQCGVVHG